MDKIEAFLFLFSDSFFSALILPPRQEMVVKLMTIFPNYNIYLVFFLALAGSVLGSLVNWWVGKYFLFLRKTEFLQNKSQEILKAEKQWNNYIVWLLLFPWLEVMANPLSVLSGFLRVSFGKFLLLILIGKCFYYYLLVFFGFDLELMWK